MRHPQHSAIAAAVREWPRTAYPEMGWHVHELSCGRAKFHESDPERFTVALSVTATSASGLLAEIRGRLPQAKRISLLIDDVDRDARLGPELLEVGRKRGPAHVVYAFLGGPPAVSRIEGVSVDTVDAAGLDEWSRTKLRGFAGADAEPAADALERQLGLVRAEFAGRGRTRLHLRLARANGEAASVLGYYDDGLDVDVFNLATRSGFRERGLARLLLADAIGQALARGRRSVLIGTDPDDTPLRWYHRLGFSDRICWSSRYDLA